jgi:hypothetical protein
LVTGSGDIGTLNLVLDLRLNASRCQDHCRQLHQHFGILLPLSGKRTVLGKLRKFSEGWLDQSHWALCPSYHQRRGQAHLETHDETLGTVIEGMAIGMGIAYPVSVFAPELSGLVGRAHACAGLVRRRSLPRSFLSPFALVIPRFRRRSILKKAHSSPPRSPENHESCPTLSCPTFSTLPLLFAPGNPTPFT